MKGKKWLDIALQTYISVLASCMANAVYDIYIGPKICEIQDKRDAKKTHEIGFGRW